MLSLVVYFIQVTKKMNLINCIGTGDLLDSSNSLIIFILHILPNIVSRWISTTL